MLPSAAKSSLGLLPKRRLTQAAAHYDVAVVGLGAMGAAAALHAADRGLKVLGIDRYSPPHAMGSTNAETRITRLAVGEGPEYLPFVARTHELWRDLEAATGETLYHRTGGLIITPASPREVSGERWFDFVSATESVATSGGIEFHRRQPAEVRAEYPSLKIRDDEVVGSEPTGGVVMCERAVALQLARARSLGATLITDTPVAAVTPAPGGGVRIETADETYTASKVIVAAGAWMADFMGPADYRNAKLAVTRQVVYWFEVEELAQWQRMPFVIWAGHDIEACTPPPLQPQQTINVL